jgi:uncharacterized Zn-finger protein
MTNKIESNLKKMLDIIKSSQNICEMNKFLGHEFNILNEFSEMSKSFNKFEANKYEKNFKFCKISATEEEFVNKSEEIYGKKYLKTKSSINKNEENFKCNFKECHKSYKYRKKLKEHQKIHSGIKYSCVWPNCKYKTFLKYLLRRHALIHSEEKNFKCDFENCDKTFKQKFLLKLHEEIHSNEKKFICDWNQCDNKFKQRSGLYQHKNEVHFKIKKYECNYEGCHQRFSGKNNLTVHSRIHSGLKPFVCSNCDKRFYSISNLNQYVKKNIICNKV